MKIAIGIAVVVLFAALMARAESPSVPLTSAASFNPDFVNTINTVPEPTSSNLAICGALALATAALRRFFKN
jgi:hypothetical protein